MAKEVEQVTLSPEEQLLNDHVENLLKVVDPGHGVPLQQELSLRLEKTVNEFHDEIAEMIEELKTNSEERRKKLKELWEHRNDEKPAVQETVIEEEDPGEISAWEKRLEIKEKSKKSSSIKPSDKESEKDGKQTKKKLGFFKKGK